MRFYDEHLKGIEPDVEDPPMVIQTSDGSYRGEEQWPPADARNVTVPLNTGEYADDVDNKGTGDGVSPSSTTGAGVWTISPPFPHDAHIAGVPRISLDLETTAPDATLAAAVYDIDEQGQATLIHRQGRLVPESGTYAFDLYGNDWKIPAGHRIGVLAGTAHSEWWLLAKPTFSTVTIKSGSLTLPFLADKRTETHRGRPSIRLEAYLANAPFGLDAELIDAATSAAFPFPPPLARPRAGSSAEAGQAARRRRATRTTQLLPKRQRAKLTARLLRLRGKRVLVVTGRAPSRTKVTVKLTRASRKVARRTVRSKAGVYRAVFRVKRAGRYRAVVSARIGGRKLLARAPRCACGSHRTRRRAAEVAGRRAARPSSAGRSSCSITSGEPPSMPSTIAFGTFAVAAAGETASAAATRRAILMTSE